MDPATAAGLVAAEQVVSTAVEGGAVAAYGLAQPTQPLSATFNPISSEAFLPRLNHTLTVVAGQAYIFGGETEPGQLAGEEVHIVSLPLKKAGNEGKPDYKCVPSLGEGEDGKVPGPRAGHTAVAIGERIYVFGGRGAEEKAIAEMGRIWVFDVNALRWSYIDPVDESPMPPPRYHHACVASQLPQPKVTTSEDATFTSQLKSTMSNLPGLIKKPSGPQEPHGTIIVSSGQSSPLNPLNDLWSFDIISQTWHPLPAEVNLPANLALSNDHLYMISHPSPLSSSLHSLPLICKPNSDNTDHHNILTSAQKEWTTTTIPTNPLTPGPQPRKGAGLIPITTGNGRSYLLYFMGEKEEHTSTKPTTTDETVASTASEKPSTHPPTSSLHSDLYALQLPSSTLSFAQLKDKTLSRLGYSTDESTWSEVLLNTNPPSSSPATGKGGNAVMEGKAHPGPRAAFAVDNLGKGMEDGVVVWGGVNGGGGVEGDGWAVRVEVA